MEKHEFNISIPNYADESVSGKIVTFYNIEVEVNGGEWVVKKRFSDFSDLLKILKVNHTNLPSLPKKTIFKVKKPEEKDKRRSNIESFLVELINREDVRGNSDFTEFIELDQNAPESTTNAMNAIGRTTHEALGFRDFILIPQRKLVFSLSCGLKSG